VTKDELIEMVAEMIAEHCCADSVEEWERETARAVVELLMPPPLVWNEPTSWGGHRKGLWRAGPLAILRHDDVYSVSPESGRQISSHPTLEAAQAAAQAHADAAWIAQTRAAQEAGR